MHQLFGFQGLNGAALYRCVGNAGGAVPVMLCCYDFGDAEGFAAYEASEVKRAAERDRQSGWGRDGISICLRAPYERLYATARDAAEPDWPVAARISACGTPASPAFERALAADAFERGAASQIVLRAAAGDGYLCFESPGNRAAPLPAGTDPIWSAAFGRLHCWRR